MSAAQPIYRHEVQVASDDIDLHGHVNNLVYLKWMQDAAVAHSLHMGWGREQYEQLGCGWVVRSHQIEYRWPAFEQEVLSVVTWVASFRRASCIRKYEVHRPSDNRILAIAETNWAFIDLGERLPKRVPAEIIEAFRVDDFSPENRDGTIPQHPLRGFSD